MGGYFFGLLLILGIWLAAEARLMIGFYIRCGNSNDSLCGEWVGAGFVTYVFLALIGAIGRILDLILAGEVSLAVRDFAFLSGAAVNMQSPAEFLAERRV